MKAFNLFIINLIVSFNAYDKDGNNSISCEELEEMFKYAWIAGFKAMKSASDEELSMEEIRNFSEECAKSFAASVMQEMDTDGDGSYFYLFFQILIENMVIMLFCI